MSKPDYAEFNNELLVSLYDTFNALGDDLDFYCTIIEELAPYSIVDIGCGTGLLTCEIAKRGYKVTGIEPSNLMLNLAKKKEYANQINWVNGDCRSLQGLKTDLILMTSHVAQFFLEEAQWKLLLQQAYNSLQTGGNIIFDSRNPIVKPWENWSKSKTIKTYNSEYGEVKIWYDLSKVNKNRVSYKIHYFFLNSGEEIISQNELIYRSNEEIKESLISFGFSCDKIYGNWDRSIYGENSPEMIFIGTKV
jgi:SAM-dependent methyltransferase